MQRFLDDSFDCGDVLVVGGDRELIVLVAVFDKQGRALSGFLFKCGGYKIVFSIR